MRKILCAFVLLAGLLIGCATQPPQIQPTETLNRWLEYSIAPSRITRTGDIIMRSVLFADGAYIVVYFDPALVADAYFYQSMLMHDFGWRRSPDGGWTGSGLSRDRRDGIMYANPLRRVALYFFPSRGTFEIFRVKIISPDV